MRAITAFSLFLLLLLGSVGWTAPEELSRTFELRYFDGSPTSNGVTDFKGKTTSLNTDQRVEFLKKYADYGKVFFKDSHLDTEIVTDKEATALLKTIKEQPLPQVRHKIPLKQWTWLGYRPGQREDRTQALETWQKKDGIKLREGSLDIVNSDTILDVPFPEQSWRFWLEWRTCIPHGVADATFQLTSGKNVVATLIFSKQGKVSYKTDSGQIDAGTYQDSHWHHCKLEVDLLEKRYNVYLDGKLLADFVSLENSTISTVSKLLVQGVKGQRIDDLTGIGFARTVKGQTLYQSRNLYSSTTIINENFESKPVIDGWQLPDYNDSQWSETQLPHAHGGERYADEDLYLRTTVNVGDYHLATLEAETLDPGGEIWINGQVAAVIDNLHPVKVEVGNYLKKNATNTIAIRVKSYKCGTWTNDPYVGWFAGRVFLNLTDKTRIDAVRVHAKDIRDPASMQFQVEVSNEQKHYFKGQMVISFYPWHPKESDTAAAVAKIPVTIRPWTQEQLEPLVEVPSPKLWSFQNPNLYKIQVELVDDAEKPVDDFVITSGIRTIDQKGGTFRINGKPEMLNGPLILGLRPPLDKISTWSRCAPSELLIKDLMQIKRMNGNAVRMAVASKSRNGDSWPDINDRRLAEMGDQMGLMFMWQTSAGLWWGDAWGVDWAGYQKFIKQVYNHPCIVMWEVNNEASTKEWNDWYQKVYDTIYPVDQSRLISGYTHCDDVSKEDDPKTDKQGNPMKPAWTASMVTRGDHDAVTGYAAQWSSLRTWDRSEFLDSTERAFFNFEHEESTGQPNWSLVKGKPWYLLHTYEWNYDKGSIGRPLECDEWQESQAWQAFSAYESMKKQRILDYDGFNWCCLHGGLFTVNYHKPLLDYYGHAKLGYYANRMVFQRTMAGSGDVDVVYGSKDYVSPVVLNLGEQRIVDLLVEIKNMRYEVVGSTRYENIKLPAGRTVTNLPAFTPEFPDKGHYGIEYTLYEKELVKSGGIK
jgi:hypothetical protein